MFEWLKKILGKSTTRVSGNAEKTVKKAADLKDRAGRADKDSKGGKGGKF